MWVSRDDVSCYSQTFLCLYKTISLSHVSTTKFVIQFLFCMLIVQEHYLFSDFFCLFSSHSYPISDLSELFVTNLMFYSLVWNTQLSVVLEIIDFPPVFYSCLDSHALWHLATAPIPFYWFRWDILISYTLCFFERRWMPSINRGWERRKHLKWRRSSSSLYFSLYSQSLLRQF